MASMYNMLLAFKEHLLRSNATSKFKTNILCSHKISLFIIIEYSCSNNIHLFDLRTNDGRTNLLRHYLEIWVNYIEYDNMMTLNAKYIDDNRPRTILIQLIHEPLYDAIPNEKCVGLFNDSMESIQRISKNHNTVSKRIILSVLTLEILHYRHKLSSILMSLTERCKNTKNEGPKQSNCLSKVGWLYSLIGSNYIQRIVMYGNN